MKLLKSLKKMRRTDVLITILVLSLVAVIVAMVCMVFKKKKAGEEKKQETFTNSFEKNSIALFTVKWCEHCKALQPSWDKFMQENQGRNDIDIVKIDADNNESIVKKFNIDGFPTIVHLKNGIIQSRFSGERNLKAFREYLRSVVGH